MSVSEDTVQGTQATVCRPRIVLPLGCLIAREHMSSAHILRAPDEFQVCAGHWGQRASRLEGTQMCQLTITAHEASTGVWVAGQRPRQAGGRSERASRGEDI